MRNAISRSVLLLLLLLIGLSLSPDVEAFDSVCFRHPGIPNTAESDRSRSCASGREAAANRWVGAEDEHRRIWEFAADVIGLSPRYRSAQRLRVFSAGVATASGGRIYEDLSPVSDPARVGAVHERVYAPGEFAQLPDFSFSLWDWANGNATCPPVTTDPPNHQDCHSFELYSGYLNANHFPPQSQHWYLRLHTIALQRGRQCAALAADPTFQTGIYREFLDACVVNALSAEAVAQHYMQDALSSGHMWERWGSSDWGDFPTTGDRSVAAAYVSAIAGIIHGSDAITNADTLTSQAARTALLASETRDRLCYPDAEVRFRNLAIPNSPLHRGFGDLYLDRDSGDLAEHHRILRQCTATSLHEVASAAGLSVTLSASDRVADLIRDCFQYRATNRALYNAIGIDYVRLTDGHMDRIAITDPRIASMLVVRAPSGVLSLADLSLRRELQAMVSHANTRKDIAPDAVDLAAGGLGDLMGVHPNGCYVDHDPHGTAAPGDPCGTARTSSPRLPLYVDPNLPWPGPREVLTTPEGAARAAADQNHAAILAATFHRGSAADLCHPDATMSATLTAYQSRVRGTSGATRRAACEACAEFAFRHLPARDAAGRDVTSLCRTAANALTGQPGGRFTPTLLTPGARVDDPVLQAYTWCGCEESSDETCESDLGTGFDCVDASWNRARRLHCLGSCRGYNCSDAVRADRIRRTFRDQSRSPARVPYDNGGGTTVHDWGGVIVQDFTEALTCPAQPERGSAIIASNTNTSAYWVEGPIWKVYRCLQGRPGYDIWGPRSLGAPYTRCSPAANCFPAWSRVGTYDQYFQNGFIRWGPSGCTTGTNCLHIHLQVPGPGGRWLNESELRERIDFSALSACVGSEVVPNPPGAAGSAHACTGGEGRCADEETQLVCGDLDGDGWRDWIPVSCALPATCVEALGRCDTTPTGDAGADAISVDAAAPDATGGSAMDASLSDAQLPDGWSTSPCGGAGQRCCTDPGACQAGHVCDTSMLGGTCVPLDCSSSCIVGSVTCDSMGRAVRCVAGNSRSCPHLADPQECSTTAICVPGTGSEVGCIQCGNPGYRCCTGGTCTGLYICLSNGRCALTGSCVPGETGACYTGPPGTSGVGVCRSGTRTCPPDGTWGACVGGVAPSRETCDNRDNDCNGIVDDSPAVTSCPAPRNGSATCAAGACGLLCNANFGDCNNASMDGCEANLQTDSANCGRCRNACLAGQTCRGGACASTCPASTPDLCGTACTNRLTDTRNCGGCGMACPPVANGTATCTSGVCGFTCATGYHRCGASCVSNTAVTTCGTACTACPAPLHGSPTCNGSACGFACDSDFHACSGSCVDNASVSSCGVGCSPCPTPPNATATCDGVRCGFRCGAGYADCDGSPTNGCEVSTAGSASNCGTCGRACRADEICSNGTCSTICSNPTPTLCGGVCVNTSMDPRNCGRCGYACSTSANSSPTCNVGVCGLACTAGFANCDALASNGCEVAQGSDVQNCGACGTSCGAGQSCVMGRCACPAGQLLCGASCVDVQSSASHCGACGNVCPSRSNATISCSSGTCGFACASGFADCDGVAGNGCEAATSGSVSNCGTCGRTCSYANAAAACSRGVCSLAGCNAGFANCDGNQANGCETNTASDSSNCGGCGANCALPNAPPVCSGGRCVVAACSSGFADCDGSAATGCESNLGSDRLNCGGCGVACGSSQTCVAGRCACHVGQTACGTVCVDLQADVSNCGTCGRRCVLTSATTACASGTCAITMCMPGFADCDGFAASGCETNIVTDPTNCGGCGIRCSSPNATASCSGGSCGRGTCLPGFADCDGFAVNGCETNINTSMASCGSCGRACAAGMTCSGGTCSGTSAYDVVVRCVPQAGWTVLDAHWGLMSSPWHSYDPLDYDAGTAFEFRTVLPEGDRIQITFRLRDDLGRERWAFDFSSDPAGSGTVGQSQCATTTATRNGALVDLHYVPNSSPGALPCNYTNLVVPSPSAPAQAVCF